MCVNTRMREGTMKLKITKRFLTKWILFRQEIMAQIQLKQSKMLSIAKNTSQNHTKM